MNPETLALMNNEMTMAKNAITEMNDGKARVCARRAVILALQNNAANDNIQWNSRMALVHLTQSNKYPAEVASAAKRLQGGLRAQLLGEVYSENPIEDAEIIIRYFVDLP